MSMKLFEEVLLLSICCTTDPDGSFLYNLNKKDIYEINGRAKMYVWQFEEVLLLLIWCKADLDGLSLFDLN